MPDTPSVVTGNRRFRRFAPWAAAAAVLVGSVAAFAYIDENSWLTPEHPAIDYNNAPMEDPVAQFERRMQSGQAKLEWDAKGWGYLPSLLKNLGINTDSQILVFSKTSFQASRISPDAPRALYFNDQVAIGSVQGGEVLEIVAQDPKKGMVFYTLDIHKSSNPGFARRDVCLQCHQSPATMGIPGIFIGSVYPSPSGLPAFKAGMSATDHRTPFDQRWGGWYVTGTHGSQMHIGNAMAPDASRPGVLELRGSQNVTSLARKFDTRPYLQPTSDLVALMTMEHQTRMTNLMTRVGWEARIAEYDHKYDVATRDKIQSTIEEMIGYMLFTDESRLREPVEGVSTFTKTFPQRGPRDQKGRSLRDFDLQTRLFKYPLSYMIYTPAFDALPDSVRQVVYRRMYEVLTGKDTSGKFARLTPTDRQAVLEILRDTKTNLPEYYKVSAMQAGMR
jgi:hypothetical protein